MEEDFEKQYLGFVDTHDYDACNALREYDRLQDERDALMYEQLPWKKGTVNGRRLNTPALPRVSMNEVAGRYNTTPERMKAHWRCIERDEERQR